MAGGVPGDRLRERSNVQTMKEKNQAGKTIVILSIHGYKVSYC